MRDHLCVEAECEEGIEFNYEFIVENREDIDNLKEDIKNGVQRSPRDNHRIIESRYFNNFIYYLENIRAKYSIGEKVHTIESDFVGALHELDRKSTRLNSSHVSISYAV